MASLQRKRLGLFAPDRPDWATDGKDWPNHAASQFVTAGGLRWHIQRFGAGPAMLLLHGTGAATHSWADLAPALAANFSILAVDLPGHGFTSAPRDGKMSLPGMAAAIAALLTTVEFQPRIAAGHSAGAAILARMCLDGSITPAALVSLNGALRPFAGIPLLAPLTRLIAGNPLVPMLFAWHAADPAVVARLLRGTGSTIPARNAEAYARLARRGGHAKAALAMMANWDLASLLAALPGLRPPLLLITGANDRSIPEADAIHIKSLLPGATHISLPGLGHLAHEEAPAACAELITDFAATQGILP